MTEQREEAGPMLNTDKLDWVKQRFEHDDPHVVIFVGTGITKGATESRHALWEGLLKHGIEYLVSTHVFDESHGEKLQTRLSAAFTPFELAQVLKQAELIEQNLLALDPEPYAAWLRDAFENMHALPREQATLDALRDLELSGAILVTTNYDSVLEETTGLPPVTWQQYDEFLRVKTRQARGILHIHGHWQSPDSVVLGRSSYDRLDKDAKFKDTMKSLWQDNSWLYVGCGYGLHDPDLGPLLEWGKQWEESALRDCYLAPANQANELQGRADKPSNLVCVGYSEYGELPAMLQGLLPEPWPFARVDAVFQEFRRPGSDSFIPVPSYAEYLAEEVPALAADAEVKPRLSRFGCAFVRDVRSVGKTTLALRIATGEEQRRHPSFYVDIAGIETPGDSDMAVTSMQRLTKEHFLLILDNAHQKPELVHRLWEQWHSRKRGSKLLIVTTKSQRKTHLSPVQDLDFLAENPDNPAIDLSPTPEDLWPIVQYTHRKLAKPNAPALATPSHDVLKQWHEDFGGTLGAFIAAVHGRLARFDVGDWDLPLQAAKDWVKEKWLKGLDTEATENLVCLAVVGALELELSLNERALPNPDDLEPLMNAGLVARSKHGLFGQYHRYRLQVASWDGLILAAQDQPVQEDEVLRNIALRDPMTAVVMTSRLLNMEETTRTERLWAQLAEHREQLLSSLSQFPVAYFAALLKAAKDGGQRQLNAEFWDAVMAETPDRVEDLRRTPLDMLANFIDRAMRSRRNIEWLWEALKKEPDRFAGIVRGTSLESVAYFLGVARTHNPDVATALWETIEKEPERLVERAWSTSMDKLANFLVTAVAHGRNVEWLWDALESESNRLPGLAAKTAVEHLGTFLRVADTQSRDLTPFVDALERDPRGMQEQVAKAPTSNLAGFCHYAPDKLVKVALANITNEHWNAVPSDESMAGGTWVAGRCQEVGRVDLAHALVRVLLKRRNRRDFAPEANGLANVAWLLNNTPDELAHLTTPFLKAVCSRDWLSQQYMHWKTTCGSIATGLRRLAMHQPPKVWRHFICRELGLRLETELAAFAERTPELQLETLRLLGAAELTEWHADSRWLFLNVPAEAVVDLATNVVEYDEDAVKLSDAEIEFWLGMRALVLATDWRLRVPKDTIKHTLDLCRLNLAASPSRPCSTEHATYAEMVCWLEQCLTERPPAVIPPRPSEMAAEFSRRRK